MQHYSQALPADVSGMMETMMPFASTMIRAIVGGAGFLLLMWAAGRMGDLAKAFHNREGLAYAGLTTLFGPALGVSLSLMAVRYADAGIASTLMALTPVLIILPYALIHKQRIKLKEVLGVVVSMVGVTMFFL
jgi:drug/metabolite transporter (DMT)-like permease